MRPPSVQSAPHRPAGRPLTLAAVAAAHGALLVGLAHVLRLPVVPPALATLTVQLLGADSPEPVLPEMAPPAPRLPQPVWAPPPVVVAEVPQPAAPAVTAASPLAVPVPSPVAPPVATPVVAPVASPAPAPTPPLPIVAAATPAASAPAPERQVSIDQVAYLQPPVLAYPLAARRLREQGQVLVRVRVDEAGRPAQALLQQSSGSRTLDDAALAAVAATRFKPYREGGVPRPFWVVMPLVFSLDA